MKYLSVLLMFASLSSFAEIYKWTDSSGRVHYGASPGGSAKSEKLEVKVPSHEDVSYETSESGQDADAKSVTLFATSWCGYCKQARQYFKQHNIDYVEYDIEKDAGAKSRYDALGGKGVPVILVGNTKMNGFSISGFESIYK